MVCLKMNHPAGKNRIWEIDLLRALAVLGMLYFHWFYLLDYWNLHQTALFEGGWDVFGDLIRSTFLIVVGVSMTLSYQKTLARKKSFFSFGVKTMKRGLSLLLIGGLITVLSYGFSPDMPIRFGVISFIGAALILLWPLVARWYYGLGLAVIILLAQKFIGWTQASLGAYILGFYPFYWPSLDYFPLVPWLASVSAGIFMGTLLFKHGDRQYLFFAEPKALGPVLWVGQNALWIYLLHIPVLALVIKMGLFFGQY